MGLSSERRGELLAPYLEIVKDCRKQAHISQVGLAEATGFSEKYITLLEGGDRIPTVDTVLALMAASGVMRQTAEQLLQELVNMFDWKE